MILALVRWRPFTDRLESDLDRLFGAFGDFPRLIERRGGWVPAIDVVTRDQDLVIRAELPGVDPEKDVEISIQNGVLTLRGERRREERTEEDGMYRMESSYGSFERNILLPEGVGEDAVKASYDRGVLEIVVQGAGRPAGRKIPIQVGERQALTVERQTD